ncbi:glycoside hydrolase family 2 TIM barrel-domain containing protein [Mucisphaera sp.]|uniref:glycoside hydrolase family 2 TIM barrel-domain containing protein n=1 Tax=Mucisphaera sp. TaxID=2913024 RepID=UPI003D10F095
MSRFVWLVAVCWFGVCGLAAEVAVASKVSLVEQGAGFRLLVDGEPYRILGAGGNHSVEALAAAGGNTLRTWGIHEGTRAELDAAHRAGVKVVLGLWLGHPRHGFDYSDIDSVAEQLAMVRGAVERYKDHPALLMWGLGNEMEHGEGEHDAAMWSHIEAAAALIHRLDGDHPVMTVFAEINEKKLSAVRRLCPSIDVIGVNSYGGAHSLPERYREAGGVLPYVVTEFGPLGPWEVLSDEHEMVLEPTSTQKAAIYERSYRALDADRELGLGSFAFLWGHKQEATHTWFGMWLDDGSKVATVDTMTRLWSGREPANLCPVIEPLEAVDGAEGLPGERLSFALRVSDPDGDRLRATWLFKHEDDQYFTGGDARDRPGVVSGAIVEQGLDGAVLVLPERTGKYRLHVAVQDGRGGAATANLPVFVAGGE